MLDTIRVWADTYYPAAKEEKAHTKKSDSSVLIGKNSGWRGSAMMDQRYRQSISDEGY